MTSKVVFILPDTSDPDLESIYSWFQQNIREDAGPGRDLQGGTTWTLRDYLRMIARQSPRAYGELLRSANGPS